MWHVHGKPTHRRKCYGFTQHKLLVTALTSRSYVAQDCTRTGEEAPGKDGGRCRAVQGAKLLPFCTDPGMRGIPKVLRGPPTSSAMGPPTSEQYESQYDDFLRYRCARNGNTGTSHVAVKSFVFARFQPFLSHTHTKTKLTIFVWASALCNNVCFSLPCDDLSVRSLDARHIRHHKLREKDTEVHNCVV